jgi:hypothetical protein
LIQKASKNSLLQLKYSDPIYLDCESLSSRESPFTIPLSNESLSIAIGLRSQHFAGFVRTVICNETNTKYGKNYKGFGFFHRS